MVTCEEWDFGRQGSIRTFHFSIFVLFIIVIIHVCFVFVMRKGMKLEKILK